MKFSTLKCLLCVFLLLGSLPVQVHAEDSNDPVYFIMPEYDRTFSFNEGLGRIVKDGKWYIIDMEGKVVNGPIDEFGFIGEFNHGVSISTICFMTGCDPLLIDIKGNHISEPELAIELWNAKKGIYSVNTDIDTLFYGSPTGVYTYTLMDKSGNFMKGTEHSSLRLSNNGLYEMKLSYYVDDQVVFTYGIMNSDGEVLATPQYERIFDFHDGVAVVKKNNKYGYIDDTGKEIVPPIYDAAYDFKQSLGLIKTGMDGENPTTGTYGVVDQQGNIILEPIYDSIDIQNNGLIVLREIAQQGSTIVDKEGRVIYKTDNGFFTEYSDGLILLYGRKGQIYIDEKGQEILRIPSGNPSAFVNGIALAKNKFIDKSGNTISDMQFIADYLTTKYDYMSNFYYDVALVTKDELYGYLNLEGDELYAPQFIYADNPELLIDNGLLRVIDQKRNQYLINTFGQTYDSASYLLPNEGMTAVSKADKWGYVNALGMEVVTPIYDKVSTYSLGLGKVTLNGKFGYVDLNGKVIVKPIYEELHPYHEDLALVKRNGLYGFVNRTGEEVIPAQYTRADQFNEGLANVMIEGRSGYIIHPDKISTIKPLSSKIAAWAESEVRASIDLGIVPLYLQTDYSTEITRGDFSSLLVRFIEVRLGKRIEDVLTERKIAYDKEWRSSDLVDLVYSSQEQEIRRPLMATYAMGIITGKGKEKYGGVLFDPHGKITRQEAAVMLTKTAAFIGLDTKSEKSSFKDKNKIASWAVQAVNWVYTNEIMYGMGDGRFAPQETYSRQQSYMTIARLYNMR
jgi:hypothetical protein